MYTLKEHSGQSTRTRRPLNGTSKIDDALTQANSKALNCLTIIDGSGPAGLKKLQYLGNFRNHCHNLGHLHIFILYYHEPMAQCF